MNFVYIRRILPTLILLLVILSYLSGVYPYRFYYQEQYQLFLMNMQYAKEVISVPGGLADYLGRFLTQFAYLKYGGPVVWAICLALFQALVAANMRNRSTGFYYLSFVPTAFLWIYLQNANALLGTGVAFILALAALLCVNRIGNSLWHGVVSLVMIPISYFLLGPIVWLFTLSCAIRQVKQRSWIFAALLVGMNVAVPLIAGQWVYLPNEALLSGVHYYRLINSHPFLIWFILGATLLVVSFPEIPIRSEKKQKSVRMLLPVASIFVSAWFIYGQTKPEQDEVLTYLYLGRTQQWDAILEKADQSPTRSVPGVCYTNLALGMKGEMGTRLMDYFQTGGGLIPIAQTDYLVSVVSGDIYYQLGMIYLAQQQYMEAMECAPDMQKSAYLYQRLAETNLINGAYPVAYKYLKALQQTLFYKDWATQTLLLVGNEKAIEDHPEYGRLRKLSFTADQYAMGTIMDFLKAQCEQHPENKLAFDYMMSCALLVKDVENLPKYLEMGRQHYPQIPMVYQQALAVSPKDSILENLNLSPSTEVKESYQQFLSSYLKEYSAQQMQPRWGKTYWFYYHYAK